MYVCVHKHSDIFCLQPLLYNIRGRGGAHNVGYRETIVPRQTAVTNERSPVQQRTNDGGSSRHNDVVTPVLEKKPDVTSAVTPGESNEHIVEYDYRRMLQQSTVVMDWSEEVRASVHAALCDCAGRTFYKSAEWYSRRTEQECRE
jgi:hypothetical protein